MNALTEQLSNDVARLTRINERLAAALEALLENIDVPYKYIENARAALDEAKEQPNKWVQGMAEEKL